MDSSPSYTDLLNLTPAEDREFDELAKRSKESMAWRDLPALLALPHPVRMAALPEAAARFVVISVAEPKNQALVKALFKEGLATTGIYDRLLALDDRRLHLFHAIHGDALGAHGGFGAGASGAMMHWARYSSCGGRIYTISDELVQLLHATHLGSDIPVSELRLPEPNIYIQLGTNRTASPFTLHHQESGEHYLEGAMVSACHQADGSQVLEVTLTGSPLGKSGVSDDSVEWMQLYGDDRVSVTDAITKAFTVPDQLYNPEIHGAESPHFKDQARLRAQAASTVPKLELIAKCILFLNLPEAVKRTILDGTEAKKVLVRSQSGAHRRKAARGVALSYDSVLVDAPPPAKDEPGHTGRTMGSHLRSGHLRNQRHGPGFSLTKVIWIRPVWVNPDAIVAAGL